MKQGPKAASSNLLSYDFSRMQQYELRQILILDMLQ